MKLLLTALAWLTSNLILLTVTLLGLPLLLAPDAYKPLISEPLHHLTGRHLTLHGPLSLALTPYLELTLRDLELSNPPGFPAAPFARIERLTLQLHPRSLTNRRLEIAHLEIDQLQLRLQRDANGNGNWDDLLPAASDSDSPALPLQIDQLTLHHSTLHWQSAGQPPLHLELHHLQSRDLPHHPQFSATLTLPPLNPRHHFDLPPLRGDHALTHLTAELQISGQLTPDDYQLHLTPLRLELDESRISGQLHLSSSGHTLDLTLDRLHADPYLAPPQPTPTAGIELLPSDWLRSHRLSGQITFETLLIHGTTLQQLRILF